MGSRGRAEGVRPAAGGSRVCESGRNHAAGEPGSGRVCSGGIASRGHTGALSKRLNAALQCRQLLRVHTFYFNNYQKKRGISPPLFCTFKPLLASVQVKEMHFCQAALYSEPAGLFNSCA